MTTNILKFLAVIILTATLVTFTAAAGSVNAQQFQQPTPQQQQQQSQSGEVQVQVLQGKPDNPGGQGKDKGDKGDKSNTGGKGKDKKPKQIQNVKISAEVDVSQVSNATDAAQAYSFAVNSGTFTSKPKSLEGNLTDSAEALILNFNGKLPVTIGDSFTITGTSSTDAYNTVVGTGTFTEQPQGKSGKTLIVGELDSPLVLSETAVADLS